MGIGLGNAIRLNWCGGWVIETVYAVDDQVSNDDNLFVCNVAHTADPTNEPGVGAYEGDYWIGGVDMLLADQIISVAGTREIIQPATDLLTVSECTNTLINNYGQSAANTQTLPPATPGLEFSVIISTTGMGAFNIKPGTDNCIYIGKTKLADTKMVILAAPEVGDSVKFYVFQSGAGTYDWMCEIYFGTWTGEA